MSQLLTWTSLTVPKSMHISIALEETDHGHQLGLVYSHEITQICFHKEALLTDIRSNPGPDYNSTKCLACHLKCADYSPEGQQRCKNLTTSCFNDEGGTNINASVDALNLFLLKLRLELTLN